ncbi:MAG: hypothetical protein ACREDR_02690 [Blastocatellia bacterium]
MRPKIKTRPRAGSGRSKPTDTASQIADANSPALSSEQIRAMAAKTTNRIRTDRFVLLLSDVHAALERGHDRKARRLASRYKLEPFRKLMQAVFAAASSGKRIDALNMLFQASLSGYENSFDHLRAYLQYVEEIQSASCSRGKTKRSKKLSRRGSKNLIKPE